MKFNLLMFFHLLLWTRAMGNYDNLNDGIVEIWFLRWDFFWNNGNFIRVGLSWEPWVIPSLILLQIYSYQLPITCYFPLKALPICRYPPRCFIKTTSILINLFHKITSKKTPSTILLSKTVLSHNRYFRHENKSFSPWTNKKS